MHKWQVTAIRDLFLCKCGLYRYPVRKRIVFRNRLNQMNAATPDKPIHSLYVYALNWYVKVGKTVSFRTWTYSHSVCTINNHDA